MVATAKVEQFANIVLEHFGLILPVLPAVI